MSFGSPLFLLALVLPVAAVIAYLWIEKRPTRAAVTFPNLEVMASIGGRSSWKRQLIGGLLLATLVLLCIAVARPKVPLAATADRATVVLVVDVSISMNAKDVAPTRLEAARAAIRTFADSVPPGIKVGLISFSDDSNVLTAPTTDRAALRAGIAALRPGLGTAIGDAVARGVDLVQASIGTEDPAHAENGGRPVGAVVLLSDGAQTRGSLLPQEGAQIAERAGVPVYTIALGTDSGTVTVSRFGEPIQVLVPPDRGTLASIAEATGGTTFEAKDAKRLTSVYSKLGRVVARTTKPREVTSAFVAAAAALLAAGIGLAALWVPRLP